MYCMYVLCTLGLEFPIKPTKNNELPVLHKAALAVFGVLFLSTAKCPASSFSGVLILPVFERGGWGRYLRPLMQIKLLDMVNVFGSIHWPQNT
jgi:hypothetical protein